MTPNLNHSMKMTTAGGIVSYHSEQLLEYLKKYPFMLAPMAGVTDYPFRSFMREMNGGILTTELVSAVALAREPDRRTHKIALISPKQHPIGIQILERIRTCWFKPLSKWRKWEPALWI